MRMFFHCMENNYFHADDELATALVVVFQANRRDTYLRDCAIAYGTRCYSTLLLLPPFRGTAHVRVEHNLLLNR